MKRRFSLLAIHLLLLSYSQNTSFAQENVVTLATCLLAQTAPTYSQPLFSVDAIEEMFVTDKWIAPTGESNPRPGADSSLHWFPKSIDEDGWFIDDALHGGYAFFSVDIDTNQVVLLEGMGHDMVYVNGVPRGGNRYQSKEHFEPWEPNFNFSLIPVLLKKGKNELVFQCSRGRLKVKLRYSGEKILFNSKDRTLPDLMAGESVDTRGAIVVVNATRRALRNFLIVCSSENGLRAETQVPVVQPMSTRKIGFRIQGTVLNEPGEEKIDLHLYDPNNPVKSTSARCTLSLNRVSASQTHKRTFISDIDGSVQYFAVNPARAAGNEPAALFLSAHGASVEAINQANAYAGKSWGHIVAPTNRRPYGYNWEDWGRLDAMEVLDIASKTLLIDPARIYLTGHSMGGHGAWHLGVTFPDRFAAVGPSAGWISFWSYRIRQSLEPASPMAQMLNRATSPSNTFALAENLKPIGVYILHGAVDDNVSADQARQMSDSLSQFHNDFIYHEEPGASHWWDNSDEPGTDCVDWAPMFDFFAHHARPRNDMVRRVEFTTASPGVSARNYWLTIDAQKEHLKLSSASIQLFPEKRQFLGATSNIARLTLDVSFLEPDRSLAVNLDGQDIPTIPWPSQSKNIVLVNRDNMWSVSAETSRSEKGPHRYGPFKDAFKNRFIFVYSTRGAEAENQWAFDKARFDAEQFWYQGNGSVDILSDVEFDPAQDTDRNVILYGNATTNAAWSKVLDKSEVDISSGRIKLGSRTFKGEDIACLMIRPRKGSDSASVGIVGGTGLKGMKLTNARRYLFPGYAFPDCVIFSTDIFTKKIDGVLAAGFFGLDWSVKNGDFVIH